MKNVRRQWQELRTSIERWLDKFCSTMDVVIEYSYVFFAISVVYLVYECHRLQRNIHLQDAALVELDKSLTHLMKIRAEMDKYQNTNDDNNNKKKKKKKKIETEIENLYSEKNVIKKDEIVPHRKDQDIMIGKSIKTNIDMNSGVTRKASHNKKKNENNKNINNDKHHNDSCDDSLIPTYEYIESFEVYFYLVYTLPPTTESF